MALHTIQNVLLHIIFISHSGLWYYFSSSSFTSIATFIWSLVFHIFTLRVYLTFEKAVTLILKHATLSQLSNSPKLALTNVDQNYRNANIDVAIKQHLQAHSSEHSVEQFAGFIMGTDIGLFILLSVTSISYHPFSASINTEWLKHF